MPYYWVKFVDDNYEYGSFSQKEYEVGTLALFPFKRYGKLMAEIIGKSGT